jgi:hypothetical protein
MPGIRRLLCLTAVTAALLVALAPSLATGARPTAAGTELGQSACNLLNHAGVPGLVTGGTHAGSEQQIVSACVFASCWETYVDPDTGGQKCHYGRGTSLALGRTKSDKLALKYMGQYIKRGYRRIKIKGADLAGIVTDSKGGAMVMAVDRTTAIFALGATSDDNPNPAWGSDPTSDLKASARAIARELNRPGCPAHPAKCPS